MPDPVTISAAIAAASAGVDLINKLADKVIPMFKGTPPIKKEHRMTIEGDGGKIVVKEHGATIKIITGADLQNLSSDMLNHVKVYERSAQNSYQIWEKVYPERNASPDPIVNAKVEQQLREIVNNMKDDLDGILEFLESAGIRLDDHYLQFRDAIKRSG